MAYQNISYALKSAVKLWSLRVQMNKSKTRPIPAHKCLLQGGFISPLPFMLITACFVVHLGSDPDICKETRGKHEIIDFVNDFKCHAPTKKGIQVITREIIDWAHYYHANASVEEGATKQKHPHFNNVAEERQRYHENFVRVCELKCQSCCTIVTWFPS